MKADSLVRVLLASVAALSSIADAGSLPLGLLQARQENCQIVGKRDVSSSDITPNVLSPLDKRQAILEGTCVVDVPRGECTIVTQTVLPNGQTLECVTRLPCSQQHDCTANGNYCNWSTEAGGQVVCQ